MLVQITEHVGCLPEIYLHKTGSRQDRSNWLGSSLPRLVQQVSESSGWAAYREAVREQKIRADVSATSITTCCLAGEKSPRPPLQGHQAQTGCVRGHPGKEAQGPGRPSGSHSCGLVVQSPLWREVPQRVSQQTPDLSLTGATWSRTVGVQRQEWRVLYSLGYFALPVFMLLSKHAAMFSYQVTSQFLEKHYLFCAHSKQSLPLYTQSIVNKKKKSR